MPGANCSIYGCSSSRRNKGIAIFKVPQGDDEYNSNWRKKIINVVIKDRQLDSSLKAQISNKSIYICEKHYPEDQLIRCNFSC